MTLPPTPQAFPETKSVPVATRSERVFDRPPKVTARSVLSLGAVDFAARTLRCVVEKFPLANAV